MSKKLSIYKSKFFELIENKLFIFFITHYSRFIIISMEKYYIGVDIGGTNTKIGLVNSAGILSNKVKVSTQSLISNGDYIEGFRAFLSEYLSNYSSVKNIGIGIPGVLNKERTIPLEIKNIPVLDGKPLLKNLENAFPTKKIRLENDANVAAWGEYCFGTYKQEKNFILITLGTGVGSAAIINGEIFKGSYGNAMEMGHTLVDSKNTLEEHIGKAGIVRKAIALFPYYKDTTLLTSDSLDFKTILKALIKDNDPLSVALFKEVGQLLGQSLVNIIRLLDTPKILIGGGWSKIIDHLKLDINQTCETYLTDYYLNHLMIERASLRNEAGIIGAAALGQKK